MPDSTRISQPVEKQPDTQHLALVLQKAYSRLAYSSGYLTQEARDWFKKHAVTPPPHFRLVATTPVAHTIQAGTFSIGIVYLPEGTDPHNTPTDKQIEQSIAAGKKLKKNTNLLIAVSPWGITEEKRFLPKAQGTFDCLFGGGDGIPFAHTIMNTAPNVIWMRPDTKGRSLVEVQFFSLPAKNTLATWKEQTTFKAQLLPLDQKIPEDMQMKQLLAPVE